METKQTPSSTKSSAQFIELAQQLILLRPRLFLPEQASHFREQLEQLKCGAITSKDDYQTVMRVCIILADRVAPATMGELSAGLSVPFSTATRVVDWLVQCDIVERFPDPDDRRVVRVQMTTTGHQYYQLFMDHIQQRIQHILSYFTPEEQADLFRLVSRLIMALNSENL